MKRITHIIILTLLAGCITSCMQNNGYIGPIFGQWRLERIVTDRLVQECDTVFFSFQSDVFQVRKVIYDSYDYSGFTGLYEKSDDMIKFNFLNYNGTDIGTTTDTLSALRDLQSLHIDNLSPIFVIEKLNRNEMILEYNSSNYIFKKLN